jgi:hypothetical protein
VSRKSIRHLVATYLTQHPVTGLNNVLPAKPKDLGGMQFTSGAPGETSGAVGVVTVEHQTEQAEAMDGAGGGRLTRYTVGLQLFHRSVEPKAEDAMDQFDDVVDATCNQLRSDPSLGLGQPAAMNAGLVSGAYEGLEVEYGEPELGTEDGGWVDTWAVVRFPVLEWNQIT